VKRALSIEDAPSGHRGRKIEVSAP